MRSEFVYLIHKILSNAISLYELANRTEIYLKNASLKKFWNPSIEIRNGATESIIHTKPYLRPSI